MMMNCFAVWSMITFFLQLIFWTALTHFHYNNFDCFLVTLEVLILFIKCISNSDFAISGRTTMEWDVISSLKLLHVKMHLCVKIVSCVSYLRGIITLLCLWLKLGFSRWKHSAFVIVKNYQESNCRLKCASLLERVIYFFKKVYKNVNVFWIFFMCVCVAKMQTITTTVTVIKFGQK